MLLVLVAYLAGFVLHAVAVVLLPLYLAQACIAFSMPVTAVCSAYAFDEPLGRGRILGVIGVCAGIVVLALGAGEPGHQISTWAFPGSLLALLVACAVIGVGLLKVDRPVALGAIAGCGYAGSALALRGLGVDITGPVIASALMIPLFGLLAFWLYSMAMTRAEVTPATGALIVTQTFVPAVVGLALLGDEVRDGASWIVAVGLILGTLGALRLAPGAAHA